MSSILLSSLLMLSPADATTDRLFASLDRNTDGRVTADEVNDSQRPYFERALRVADRNEDGSLTAGELSAATAPPKPVALPGAGFGGRGGMAGGMQVNAEALKRLDQNKDNEITIDEVPEPMKPRFQEMLDRVGRTSISLNALDQLQRGEPGARADMKAETGDAEMMDRADSKKSSERAKMSDELKIEPKQSPPADATKPSTDQPRARLKAKMQNSPRRKKP